MLLRPIVLSIAVATVSSSVFSHDASVNGEGGISTENTAASVAMHSLEFTNLHNGISVRAFYLEPHSSHQMCSMMANSMMRNVEEAVTTSHASVMLSTGVDHKSEYTQAWKCLSLTDSIREREQVKLEGYHDVGHIFGMYDAIDWNFSQ